jgi:hypothetical protein
VTEANERKFEQNFGDWNGKIESLSEIWVTGLEID